MIQGWPGTFARRLAGRVCSILAPCAILVSCAGDPAGFAGTAMTLHIVQGASGRDTVGAVLDTALIVEVRHAGGQVAADIEVHFEGAPIDSATTDYMARVAEPLSPQFWQRVTQRTDEFGRAAVVVRLGPRVGVARVVASTGDAVASDTATYEVDSGAPDALVVAPPDTALYEGASYTERALVVDRFGNPTGLPVEFVAGGAAEVDATGLVTGGALGRGLVVAKAGPLADTAWVSVVPPGTAVAVRQDPTSVACTLELFELDGSNWRTLSAHDGCSFSGVAWAPSASELVLATWSAGTGDRLSVVTLGGTTRPLLNGTFALGDQGWPAYAPDGARVYFSARHGDQSTTVWRASPDGAIVEQVVPSDVSFELDTHPSPTGDRPDWPTQRAGRPMERWSCASSIWQPDRARRSG